MKSHIGVHTHPVNLQKHNKLDPGAGHTQLPISLRLSSFAPFLIWFISIFFIHRTYELDSLGKLSNKYD